MSVALTTNPIEVKRRAEHAVLDCVNCGAHQTPRIPVIRANGSTRPFDLHRCTTCGLIQQFPRYSAGELAALYGASYYVFDEREADRWARAVQQYVIHLLPHESKSPKRLLDVGCALGHVAALAQRRGWRVMGIDISANAVSRAHVEFGIDARAGALEQHVGTLPPFDVILLGDVIEHLPQPVAFLQRVRSLLSPNGVVCIDTPNFASRWRKIGRSNWIALNRYHINLFEPDTMRDCLRRAGFGDVAVRSYTNHRYETWASRPEVQALIAWLPGGLQWRAQKILSRYNGFGRWSGLRRIKPQTLDEARARVSDFAHYRLDGIPKLTRDNLAVTARVASPV